MKKTDHISIRETLALHLRAARDVNKYSPGMLLVTSLSAVVQALSPTQPSICPRDSSMSLRQPVESKSLLVGYC